MLYSVGSAAVVSIHNGSPPVPVETAEATLATATATLQKSETLLMLDDNPVSHAVGAPCGVPASHVVGALCGMPTSHVVGIPTAHVVGALTCAT